jgi:hypothetical protein
MECRKSPLASGVSLAIRLPGEIVKAAGRGEFAPLIDRRNGVAIRQCDELVASAEEERIGADDERASPAIG